LTNVFSDDPCQSSYDHGYDDIGISNSSDRCINIL
jgi:hypothetical protein